MGHSLWSRRGPHYDPLHVRIVQARTIKETSEEVRNQLRSQLETNRIRQYQVLRHENDLTPDIYDVHRAYSDAF